MEILKELLEEILKDTRIDENLRVEYYKKYIDSLEYINYCETGANSHKDID